MRNKMISITEELYETLRKEHNASNLICRLLRKHYELTATKALTPEEREQLITIKKIQLKAMEDVEAIKNGVN